MAAITHFWLWKGRICGTECRSPKSYFLLMFASTCQANWAIN